MNGNEQKVAEGTVKSCEGGKLILQPKGTSYELHLASENAFAAGQPVRGVISLKGRKVWTVSAGGAFITPIFGTPRVIQGRVLSVDGNSMVVQAGAAMRVELPSGESAMDLKNGGVVPGVMVNVTTLPGARFDAVNV